MSIPEGAVFNPPPGWPKPPPGWKPPLGWTPDPKWPTPPEGWQIWVTADEANQPETEQVHEEVGRTESATSGVQSEQPPESVSSEARVRNLERENAALREQISRLQSADSSPVNLDDDQVLQNVSIYRYHHPLENSVAYQERLKDINSRIADTVKSGNAIVKSNMFTFDNSLAKGRRMTADLSKLMLRAYNAEADNSIRSLRLGNVVTAKRRLESSRTAIAKLGALMEMRISDEFHALRIEEIELTADWLMMKQEEKEAAREARAQLREQARVERELAEERARLDKEQAHLQNALDALRSRGEVDADLEQRLATVKAAIEQNDFRAANIRAGYVYVISNRGAFGENVVKIGLTRRLYPEERIAELSGASVPFRFDVHALYFSEDAVTLENELHRQFADRRMNQANPRKEFFFVSPAEVREALKEKVGNLLDFTEHADATEFVQSLGLWPEGLRSLRTP
ncbi:DUF4041 domain-containing protein [Glycomyces sp. NPDC046736]|uniref:DUF4041 domain-containing protein n=1 Tax=Glycomyces sp. NPDC046736 TaxID=3155615 RepID=UPI0033EB448C